MKKKDLIALSLFCFMLVGTGIYFYYSWKYAEAQNLQSKKNDHSQKVLKTHSHHAHNHAHGNHNQQKRNPAAITPIDYSKYQVNSEWKKLTLKKIKNNLSENYLVEIEEVRAHEMPKSDGTKKLVQEVVVNITHPSKAKSSYSAIIDNATGSIIETFNQVQYEKRDFYAVKLKADYNTLQLVPLNKKQQ